MGVGCVPGHQPMSERSLFPAQGARDWQAGEALVLSPDPALRWAWVLSTPPVSSSVQTGSKMGFSF